MPTEGRRTVQKGEKYCAGRKNGGIGSATKQRYQPPYKLIRRGLNEQFLEKEIGRREGKRTAKDAALNFGARQRK